MWSNSLCVQSTYSADQPIVTADHDLDICFHEASVIDSPFAAVPSYLAAASIVVDGNDSVALSIGANLTALNYLFAVVVSVFGGSL